MRITLEDASNMDELKELEYEDSLCLEKKSESALLYREKSRLTTISDQLDATIESTRSTNNRHK